MAECPRGAILVPDLTRGKMNGVSDTPDIPHPKITLFCCERSAGRALATAKVLEGFSSENLNTVFLPCAGGLSLTDVMEAFSKGAQGVMVLTCHPGNCNSETGALLAKQRFSELKNRLIALGLDSKRFRVESLAANMAAGFSGLIHEFRAQLGD
jgi:coenzyme F420-reducing hydrogenase delta subunit